MVTIQQQINGHLKLNKRSMMNRSVTGTGRNEGNPTRSVTASLYKSLVTDKEISNVRK